MRLYIYICTVCTRKNTKPRFVSLVSGTGPVGNWTRQESTLKNRTSGLHHGLTTVQSNSALAWLAENVHGPMTPTGVADRLQTLLLDRQELFLKFVLNVTRPSYIYVAMAYFNMSQTRPIYGCLLEAFPGGYVFSWRSERPVVQSRHAPSIASYVPSILVISSYA